MIQPSRNCSRIAEHPSRIDDAIWQAGVTPRSERFKVLLNGEPLVGAVAAGNGWVTLAGEQTSDPFSTSKKIYGRVQLVRCNED